MKMKQKKQNIIIMKIFGAKENLNIEIIMESFFMWHIFQILLGQLSPHFPTWSKSSNLVH
jgi:hypothetical protein